MQAYVLHSRNYSDSSLLIELITADLGRLPVIARGVKGKKRPTAGLLQPFSPLQVEWRGRGEIKSLTSFEQVGTTCKLTGDRLYCGFYLNELLIRLLARNDPHQKLYFHYSETISKLASGGSIEPTLRHFEVMLLLELGYGLSLEYESCSGEPIKADQRYHYQIEQGPMLSVNGDPNTVSGKTLMALARGDDWDATLLTEARQLTRTVLSYYLGDKPLRSRELFRGIQPVETKS